jgi:hypothetical protein
VKLKISACPVTGVSIGIASLSAIGSITGVYFIVTPKILSVSFYVLIGIAIGIYTLFLLVMHHRKTGV